MLDACLCRSPDTSAKSSVGCIDDADVEVLGGAVLSSFAVPPARANDANNVVCRPPPMPSPLPGLPIVPPIVSTLSRELGDAGQSYRCLLSRGAGAALAVSAAVSRGLTARTLGRIFGSREGPLNSLVRTRSFVPAILHPGGPTSRGSRAIVPRAGERSCSSPRARVGPRVLSRPVA